MGTVASIEIRVARPEHPRDCMNSTIGLINYLKQCQISECIKDIHRVSDTIYFAYEGSYGGEGRLMDLLADYTHGSPHILDIEVNDDDGTTKAISIGGRLI